MIKIMYRGLNGWIRYGLLPMYNLVSIFPKLWVMSMFLSFGMSTPPRNSKGRCFLGKADIEMWKVITFIIFTYVFKHTFWNLVGSLNLFFSLQLGRGEWDAIHLYSTNNLDWLKIQIELCNFFYHNLSWIRVV